jgi:DNA-binding transcriptional regulator YiaG
MFPFGLTKSPGLSPKQQQLTRKYMKQAPHSQDGIISVNQFAKKLDMNAQVLHTWLQTHADLVGEVRKFRFGQNNGLGLMPGQQQIVREHIKRPVAAPDGVVSVAKFAEKLGVAAGTFHSWLQSHATLMGEIQKYQFGPRIGVGLTPEQQQAALNHMERPVDAPDGAISVARFAAKLDVAVKTLHFWLQSHPDIVGEVRKFRFGKKNALGLTLGQQRVVREHMERQIAAPDGVVSVARFTRGLNISIRTLHAWLQSHADLVGAVQKYRFDTSYGLGLTPAQQAVIQRHLHAIGHRKWHSAPPHRR